MKKNSSYKNYISNLNFVRSSNNWTHLNNFSNSINSLLPSKTNFVNRLSLVDKKMKDDKYDLIYSRFTLHSINDEEVLNFLKSIKSNTYLVIETRSDKGSLNNLHHGNTHYRNLTNLNNLILILINLKYQIIYLEENYNFAMYHNENPICIRIICKK